MHPAVDPAADRPPSPRSSPAPNVHAGLSPADLGTLAAVLADRVAELVEAARTPPPLLDIKAG